MTRRSKLERNGACARRQLMVSEYRGEDREQRFSLVVMPVVNARGSRRDRLLRSVRRRENVILRQGTLKQERIEAPMKVSISPQRKTLSVNASLRSRRDCRVAVKSSLQSRRDCRDVVWRICTGESHQKIMGVARSVVVSLAMSVIVE